MSENTELPWKEPLQLRECKEHNTIDDADGRALFLIVGITAQTRGTRKRIGDAVVRACNAHKDLLTALQAVKVRLHFVGLPSEPMNDSGPDWSKEIKQLEAAIEKAKP